MKGIHFWLKQSLIRLGRFKSPRKKTKSEIGNDGIVEVGRKGEGVSPPKPILDSKRSCPTHADAGLGEIITGRKQNHRLRWKPKEMLGRGSGDSSVTDVPRCRGRGCLASGGKPTGLLRRKRVSVLASQTCHQGWMGIRGRWVGEKLLGVHWKRKK